MAETRQRGCRSQTRPPTPRSPSGGCAQSPPVGRRREERRGEGPGTREGYRRTRAEWDATGAQQERCQAQTRGDRVHLQILIPLNPSGRICHGITESTTWIRDCALAQASIEVPIEYRGADGLNINAIERDEHHGEQCAGE